MHQRGIIKSSHRSLCAGETKLHASFPDDQFKIPGYQFPPLGKDGNSKGGENSSCLQGFYCKTN